MRVPLVPIAILFLLGGCLQAATIDPSPGPALPAASALPAKMVWRMLPAGLTPRAETCTARVGSLFYVMGGYANPNEFSLPGPAGAIPYDETTNTATVDVFNAATETWTAGPKVPVTSFDHCDAIGYNGTAYLFHSSGNWKLENGSSAWTAIKPWPNNHNYGAYGEIAGKFYFTAGGSAKLDMYDPATDTWQTLASPIPTQRGHTGGAALDGKLYVIGGDVGGHSQNTAANEVFDPATGQWETKAPLPLPRGSLHEVAYRGHVLVMGGQNGGGGVDSFNNVNVYDPRTDSWSELPPMITPKHGFGAGEWNDRVYVFAGSPQQGVDATAKASVLEPVPS